MTKFKEIYGDFENGLEIDQQIYYEIQKLAQELDCKTWVVKSAIQKNFQNKKDLIQFFSNNNFRDRSKMQSAVYNQIQYEKRSQFEIIFNLIQIGEQENNLGFQQFVGQLLENNLFQECFGQLKGLSQRGPSAFEKSIYS